MKLLHVVPTYVPARRHGGPALAVHGLARALAALGHQVTVLTTDVDGDERLDVPLGRAVPRDGVEVLYFPVHWPRRLYRSPGLAREARRRLPGFDVAHLHSVFLAPTSAVARAAERAGIPYLVAPRGMLVPELIRRRGRWRKTWWLRLVERRTIARAAGLHVTGDLEADDVARLGLLLPAVYRVPNGIDPADLRLDPAASLSGPVRAALTRGTFLLVLGRLSWKKGIDRLIAALPQVSGIALVVAGNDEEGLTPALARQAAELSVADRVLFTGAVEGAEKAALLHAASLLVLPSHSENFGNVVLEAMAVGRAVVVTPEVGLACVVAEAGAGLVVPGEPEALAQALAELLAARERREEMGRRGMAAALGRFGWPAVARQMVEVYEEVARKRVARG